MIAPDLMTLARPIASLREDPKNARKHDERNVAAIAESLRVFGQRKPVVALADGTVIAGNGTLRGAQLLGWEALAVATFEDETQALAYAVADNKTALLADWDDALLAEALNGMSDELRKAVGFSGGEIEQLIASLQPEQESMVPLPAATPVTRPGDLWILGEHRLLCGDSSSAADLDRLLAGAPVHMVNTDPPYNVKVEPRSNNAIAAGNSSFKATHHQKLDLALHPEKAQGTTAKMRAKDRPLANDFVSDDEFDRLLAAWFGNIARVLVPGRSFYIWGGYANCANYPPAMKAAELYFSQSIIWDKQHPVLTRKDFMGAHEWCFYGWRLGAGHEFFGPANATDLWAVKKVNPQSMVHLTEKPVELASRAIMFSSKDGENVLDLFGGSGSTLMACEETGRRGHLMELDPPYCDVILMRWQNATGRQAVLESTGKTRTEMAAERGVDLTDG